MKTRRTFKPGDYCRFKTEEIPSIIELLKANGWGVNKRICFNESHDCIIVNEEGGFHSYKLSKSLEAKNVIHRHDFIVTALRLNEGDGLRSDISTPEQREHVSVELEKLGVDQFVPNSDRLPMEYDLCFYLDSEEWLTSSLEEGCVKNHIDYSDWCKRLNIEPIGEKSVTWINELTEIRKDFTNHIPDVGKTITLPDGTTVDLTKPLEGSYDYVDYIPIFHFIGVTMDGNYLVNNKHGGLKEFKHIRNKPDPKFKPVDKLKDLDEDLKAFIVSNLPELDWVGSDSCASAFLSVDEDGVIEDSLILSLSKAVIACSDKPFSLSIRPVESEVLLYYID